MPQIIKQLTNTEVDRSKPKDKEYLLSDGSGLHLRIKPNGKKYGFLMTSLYPAQSAQI